MCISWSFFVVGVIFFTFTILIYLLLMQASQNSSISLKLYSIASFKTSLLLVSICESLSGLKSEEWHLLTSPNTSARLIPSISLEAWTTRVLLVWPRHWCQSQICRLELYKYIDQSFSYTSIILSTSLVSKTKRFLYLTLWLIIFSTCLRIIESGWSWYMIPDSWSWSKDMRFELYFGVYITLIRVIFLL